MSSSSWSSATCCRPWQRTMPAGRCPFCDVFCEEGAFSLAQSRRILLAARDMGFPLKIHVDEFESLGGTRLAVELGAVSADHIVCTPPDEIGVLARSDTVAVSLPGTPFGLAEIHYSPARAIVDGGGILALATDLNPGTSYCESMPFIIALACRTMRLWPAEAIVAATLNAAYAIGRGDSRGQHRGRQTSRPDRARYARLSSTSLSLWHESGAHCHQAGRGGRPPSMGGITRHLDF